MPKAASRVPGKVPGKNPSPIGTQNYPVSDPQDAEKSVVEKEAEARKKVLKEQSDQRKADG